MPSVRYALVCDEVRREDNGKLLLIGTYASSIVFQRLPANIGLSLICCIDADQPFSSEANLRALLNDEVIRTARGRIEVQEPSFNNLFPIPKMPLSIREEGTLTFELQFDEESWQRLIAVPVILQPS